MAPKADPVILQSGLAATTISPSARTKSSPLLAAMFYRALGLGQIAQRERGGEREREREGERERGRERGRREWGGWGN